MSFAAGVGIANADIIYRGLSRLPAEGEEVQAQGLSLQPGGGVVATMAALQHLGVPGRVATYLGDDLFSAFMKESIAGLGVRLCNLWRGQGIPLSVTTVALTPGERTFLSYIDRQNPDDDERQKMYDLCTGARVMEMQPVPGHLEVYRRLKAEGTLLVLDSGWDDAMSFESYHDYLTVADYFTPNRKEALHITGEATPEKAALRLQEYFEKVIVKLDSEGCLVVEGGQLCHIPSVVEFTHVDSTGAGDAFLAGLLYGLYHGASFPQSVLYGNITGGNCVSSVGCLSSLLDEKGLLEWARKYRHHLEA